MVDGQSIDYNKYQDNFETQIVDIEVKGLGVAVPAYVSVDTEVERCTPWHGKKNARSSVCIIICI